MEAQKRQPAASRGVGLLFLVVTLLTVYSFSQHKIQGYGSPLQQTDPAGEASYLNSAWDLPTAAQQRQCPPVPQNGSAVSIALLHIPKTAGTLLVETMRAMVPPKGPGSWCTRGGKGADLPAVYSQCGREQGGWADPEPAHLQLLAAVKRSFPSRCGMFATHHDIRFFKQAGIDFTRTLTLVALRHPVERQISDYFFSLKKRPDFMQALGYAPTREGDYTGLLKFAREVGSGHQVRQLSGAFGCRWPGGPTTRPEGRAMLEVAKRNLQRFCVIVIAELMHESRARLAAAAGWDVESLLHTAVQLEGGAGSGRVNGNPHAQVPEEIKQAIAAESFMEMELYDYAVQLFLQGAIS